MTISRTIFIVALVVATSHSFTSRYTGRQSQTRTVACEASRRDIVSSIPAALLLQVLPAYADENGDLTTQMFNADGSLKEGVESEAKQRSVEFTWDFSDNLEMSEDGKNVGGTKQGNEVRLSYNFPFKWSDGKDGDEVYFDRSGGTNAKACKRITVFQAPGKADVTQLSKASTVGVAKSIGAPGSLKRLYSADIIAGRIAKRNDQTYYEFDMAAAPPSCGSSAENLGLGFCPYDNIFLISATILDDRLYSIVVECDSTRMWKLASSDLKRVRSSFLVDKIA
eukprot:scaffold22620_cov131-Cylindrotheca_fusiformis.AAC.29